MKKENSLWGEVRARTSPRSVLLITITTIIYGALAFCQARVLLRYPLTSPTWVETALKDKENEAQRGQANCLRSHLVHSTGDENQSLGQPASAGAVQEERDTRAGLPQGELPLLRDPLSEGRGLVA